ncbi:MAG: C25 family cysteine peptidase [Thermoplasmatota archaeon]
MNGTAAVLIALVISIQIIPHTVNHEEGAVLDPDDSEIPVTTWPDGFGPGGFRDIGVDRSGPDIHEVVYSTKDREKHGGFWGGNGTELVLLLVDSVLHPSINDSLLGYVRDLEITGYAVCVINGSWSSAGSVRTLLNDSMDEGLVGAVLIGDVIEAWYEMDNPSPWGHEEFPVDYYYMDLDGGWGDSDGDGIFDSHTGNTDPEIWIGRLRPSVLGNEIFDMENYFRKNHEYKNGSLSLPHNSLVYIDDDWAAWADSWNSSVALAYGNGTLVSDGATTIHTDYENRLSQDHESVLLAAHSHPSGHVFKIGSEYTGGSTSTAEIKSIDPHSHFYNLFCCSGCRYTSADNIGTQYVFSDTYGLLAVGSTKTGSMLNFDPYYGPLGVNESFGEAFRKWMKVQAENDPKWFYGMTILGDPTLTTIHDVTVNEPDLSSPTHPDQDRSYSVNDPRLEWTGPEDLSGIAGYYYRLDQDPDSVPDSMSDTYTEDLSIAFTDLSDGIWYFHLTAVDSAGNIGKDPARYRIDIDTVPPTGSVEIDSENGITVNRTVSLTVGGFDENGIEFMRFSEDRLNWTDWEPYNETGMFNLSEGDGVKTVYLELKDRANLTNTDDCFDTVTLDTTPPNGSLSINDGDAYTTNLTVSYHVQAVDLSGIESMRLGVPGQPFGPWEDYEPYGTFTFSPADGEKELRVMMMDLGGLVSSVNITDTIILDTTPPEGIMGINNGDVYTTDPLVTIAITCIDDNPVPEIRLRNEDGEWGEWTNISDRMEFGLTPGDGIKRVYAELRDEAGLVSDDIVTDSIRLDTVPPNGSFEIMGGDPFTSSPNVTLDLFGEDRWEVRSVSLSNDGINWTGWIDYEDVVDHDLTGGDGEKTVFAVFMDGAGLVSDILSDTIILDTTPPTASAELADGDGFYLRNVSGRFRISSSEPIQLCRYGVNGDRLSGWRSFDDLQEIPLGAEGEKEVVFQFMDLAGLISENITIPCFVDTTPPVMTLDVDEYTWYGNYDEDSVKGYFVSNDPGSPLSGYTMSYQNGLHTEFWDLKGIRYYDDVIRLNWSLIPEGRSGVAISLFDTAGNMIGSTFDILKDTSDPVITLIGDGFRVRGDSVDIMWAPADPTSDIGSMYITVDGGERIVVDEAPDKDGIITYTIEDLKPGEHTIRLVVTDRAGNSREEILIVEIPDRGLPLLPVIVILAVLALFVLVGIGMVIRSRRRGYETWEEE